jgi:hypothetical protein
LNERGFHEGVRITGRDTRAPRREELESKSVKELQEICRFKEIDMSKCENKRNLEDLIISNYFGLKRCKQVMLAHVSPAGS